MKRGINPRQVKKLIHRRDLKPAARATHDYKMAKKLESQLDSLAGTLFIMKALPPEKLKKSNYIKDNHIRLLLELTETALRILDYKKVRGAPENPYYIQDKKEQFIGIDLRTGQAMRSGGFYRAKARKIDIDRANMLWRHVDNLRRDFAPDKNFERPSLVQTLSLEDQLDDDMTEEPEEPK